VFDEKSVLDRVGFVVVSTVLLVFVAVTAAAAASEFVRDCMDLFAR
jgi:hypothetical protein